MNCSYLLVIVVVSVCFLVTYAPTTTFGETRLRTMDSELLDASAKGDQTSVQSLIDTGANVNAKIDMGATPLHRAAYKGHYNIAELLLKNKADPKIVDKEGKTALDYAKEKGHKKIVTLLQKAMASGS